MLSVIIPALNEIYLEKTIRNVLENAQGEIEIIAILDGYIPDPQIVIHDSRVKFVHNEKSIGQRAAINQGARLAVGKYVMKLDAHCAVGPGFDVILAADCEYDWTVVGRMYNLDVDTWKPKHFDNYTHAVRMGKVHDYIMMCQKDGDKLRTWYYPHDANKKIHHDNEKVLIDDSMSLMGCCFFMHKDRFWELDGCDEGHGSWGQQGIEVACKAWLSGGSLKVNKKTWFAHWFRGGGGPGWPYHMSQKQIDHARAYSEDLWLNDKWPKATRKFSWLLDKFNPPGKEKFYVSSQTN